ncbi:hypothetical protein AM497_00085 [Helicobacter pylori]|nr:hypothetical protein AM497_00085 [Helicobacter pylori]
MQTPQNSKITHFLKQTLEFLGEMIAKPFYLLKKIIFTTKFTTNLKKKSLLQQISNNQTKNNQS